jgi:MscS family membrane protein
MKFNTGFLGKKFLYNTWEDWILALIIIVVTIAIARLAYLVFSRVMKMFTGKTENKLDDVLVEKLETPAVFCIILIGFNVAMEYLHFTPTADKYIHRAFVFLTALSLTWLLIRIVYSVIEEYLKPQMRREEHGMNEQMVMLIERGAGLILWTLGIVVGLNNAGFDVGALIAGLGIGGLALALAAQDTVKNIFGGMMVFLDKPFKLGDRIKIGSLDGFVEYIGIRSTRIKNQEGRIVTIPNAQFSDSPIENITIEPSRKVVTVLGLVYSTTAEQMEQAMNILRDISEKSGKVNHWESTISFEKFSPSSLDIQFVYFIKKTEDIPKAQTEINLQILKRFKEAGLDFAYPTQTVYQKQLV